MFQKTNYERGTRGTELFENTCFQGTVKIPANINIQKMTSRTETWRSEDDSL